MRKFKFTVAAVILLAGMTGLNSCIGNFALTHRVLNWNKQVGPKFVNELVFFAFWIVPVYEVTAIADLLVINSIEFWSGNNPMEAYSRTVETEHGKYIINGDENGYTVLCPQGETIRLDFERENQTWSVRDSQGQQHPFMTMIDDSHVKMITPEGDMRMVELSAEGLMAYHATAAPIMMAAR